MRRFHLTYCPRFHTLRIYSGGKFAFEDDGDGDIYKADLQGPVGSINYMTGAVELHESVTGPLEVEYKSGFDGSGMMHVESIGEENGFVSPTRRSARHASAPKGLRCADCEIDERACFECVRAFTSQPRPPRGVPAKPRFPRGHLEDLHGRPHCPNCGSRLHGDGYKTVLHCEFVDITGFDKAYEPDGSPVYCKPEGLDEDDIRPATTEVLKERYQKMRAQADKDLEDLRSGMGWKRRFGKPFIWELVAVVVAIIVAIWIVICNLP